MSAKNARAKRRFAIDRDYDKNSNLATVTDASGTTTYTYNDLNQLVSITDPSNDVTTFQYNPLGFLVGENVGGAQTNYLVDPTGLGNVVSSYDGNNSNALFAHYNYGLGLVSQTGSSGAGYYDFDLTGNTAGITGSAGTYVNQYSYLPFGETTTVSAILPNPFTFVGQFGVMQIGSNLFYMRARTYAPATGQFAGNDPFGLAGGDFNVRRYVGNAPTYLVDPLGLEGKVGGLASFLGGLGKQSKVTGDFANSPDGTEFTQQQQDVYNQGGQQAFHNRLKAAEDVYNLAKFSNPVTSGGARPNIFDKDFRKELQNFGNELKKLGEMINKLAIDPNALVGPAGFGTPAFVSATGALSYTAQFENDGSAAAQDVTVTEQLDANLDWSTFQLGSFGFGPINVTIPVGLTQYQTTVSYQNSDGSALNVLVDLDFNVETGLLTVTYTSLDPLTGQAPTGVFDGFLPPDDATHVGEGFVQYTVQPKGTLATGATINQQASVVFDTNDALATTTTTNTIDAGLPTSSVASMPVFSATTIALTWAGQDDVGGSGIASYTIYVSDNGGGFTAIPSLTNVTQTSGTFAGEFGHTYAFFSVATDNVGNAQPMPSVDQASTTVASFSISASQTENSVPAIVKISTLLGSHFSDADGAASKPGIAITALTGDGVWQYSPNGVIWRTIDRSTPTLALLLPGTDSLRFVPTANWSGEADLAYAAWDGSQGRANTMFDITATGAASAFSAVAGQLAVTVSPVPFWVGSRAALTSITPGSYSVSDPNTPAGDTVAAIFGPYFHDDNSAVPVGIAVIGLTGTTAGTWQFSMDNGTSWTPFLAVSASSALLLTATDRIRFVPKTSTFVGTVALTSRAWDGSVGTDGTKMNPGQLSAFTKTTLVATLAVNRAPSVNAVFIDEPAVATGTASRVISVATLLTQAGYSDADGSTRPRGIAIVGETSLDDIVQYHLPGGAWTPLPSVSASSAFLLPSNAALRLIANVFPGTATITFAGWDETEGLAGQAFDIASSGGASAFSSASATVSWAIMQAPSWTASAGAFLTSLAPGSYSTSDTSAPAGDTIASVFGGFFQDASSSVTVGVAVAGLIGNGVWQYSTDAGASWSNFAPLPSKANAFLLSADDLIRFVPRTAAAGVARLIAYAWDGSTGTAGTSANLFRTGTGGVSAFSPTPMLAVAAANRAPVLAHADVSEPAILAAAFSPALSVNTLLAQAGFSDPDGARAPRGIALVGAASTSGFGEYWLPGVGWRALPAVSITSALLLPGNALLRLAADTTPGTATLTFAAWDETQGAAGQIFDIASTGGATAFSASNSTLTLTLKQAPSWNARAGALLTPIVPGSYDTSNPSSPAGDRVADVFASFFVDGDPDRPVGIAIAGATGVGTWQYSTDAGSTWSNVIAPSKAHAFLLAKDDLIRFVPRTTAAGAATLLAFAWDGSAGTPGTTANLVQQGIGGVSAFSATTLTAVCHVNTAPTLATLSVTLPAVNENAFGPAMTVASLLAKAGYADADGRAVPSGIAITGDTGSGTWQWLFGNAWTALPALASSSAFLLPGTARVRFQPDNDLNANDSATLTYLGWDETAGAADKTFDLVNQGGASAFGSASASATMAVNFVEQAPIWTRGVSAMFTPVLSLSESNPSPNPPGDTVASIFGNAFSAAPGVPVGIAVTALGGTSLGTWQYSTDGGTNWTDVPTTVAISKAFLLSATDLLRFVPSKAFSGAVTLSAYAWDGTGGFTSPVNLLRTGRGRATPFSAIPLTATCQVNSAPALAP